MRTEPLWAGSVFFFSLLCFAFPFAWIFFFSLSAVYFALPFFFFFSLLLSCRADGHLSPCIYLDLTYDDLDGKLGSGVYILGTRCRESAHFSS